MTNDECPMTKESPMSNDETCQSRLFGHSGFRIDWSFVICHLSLTGSFCPLQGARIGDAPPDLTRRRLKEDLGCDKAVNSSGPYPFRLFRTRDLLWREAVNCSVYVLIIAMPTFSHRSRDAWKAPADLISSLVLLGLLNLWAPRHNADWKALKMPLTRLRIRMENAT